MAKYFEQFLGTPKENGVFYLIQDKLKEGLDLISKTEKLSRNEGQIKLVFGGEVGIEIYAPHLIPNALSYSWLADTFDKALNNCIKDLTEWIEIEKDAPRDKFYLDM